MINWIQLTQFNSLIDRHVQFNAQRFGQCVNAAHNAIVKTIFGIPNSGRHVRVANAGYALRLQQCQRHFACIILTSASIVKENAAWFLAECQYEFSG